MEDCVIAFLTRERIPLSHFPSNLGKPVQVLKLGDWICAGYHDGRVFVTYDGGRNWFEQVFIESGSEGG